MLEIAKVTFKAFGKVRNKDIVIPNQCHFFGDFDTLKKCCIDDNACSDFVVLNVNFRKVEVFQ